ncbi:hypothetical protein [Streptomyces sp. NPDC004629]|uniref:hypothetical protein n=1 Tax=Streptomyces sp. NPDC004629 TaxID=3364705 RepID=UPI00367E14E0
MANPTTFGRALRLAVGVASCAVSGTGFPDAGGARRLNSGATRRCSAAAGRPGPCTGGGPAPRGLPVPRDGEDTGAVRARVCRSGEPARLLERLVARLLPEPGVLDLYRHPDHGSFGTEREATAA